MTLRIELLLTALLATCPLVAQGPPAPVQNDQVGGNLTLMPPRVVLEGRARSEEVVLRNAGKVATTYRILFKEMEMDENGEVHERTKKEGEITAADIARFSPKQVDLAPGESQTVRIQLRKPEGLPDGEYRSHLLFQAVPPIQPPEPLDPNAPEKKLSVKITTLVGISIPVIIRHGETSGKITLDELRYWQPDIPDAPPVLSLHMNREGNRSLSGKFTATVESGGKLKKGTQLWEIQSAVIYDNLPYRNIHMPMYQGLNGDLKGARIKVTFTPADFKGEPVVAYLEIPS